MFSWIARWRQTERGLQTPKEQIERDLREACQTEQGCRELVFGVLAALRSEVPNPPLRINGKTYHISQP